MDKGLGFQYLAFQREPVAPGFLPAHCEVGLGLAVGVTDRGAECEVEARSALRYDKQHREKTRMFSPPRAWRGACAPGEVSRSNGCHCLLASEK